MNFLLRKDISYLTVQNASKEVKVLYLIVTTYESISKIPTDYTCMKSEVIYSR